MILLSFTVRNHKSIRDEITIDLTRPTLHTLKPADGNWKDATFPVAALFGGNATGKSTILDAINYAFTAISKSATSWQASKQMLRDPFSLDGNARTSTSTYEFDFICEDIRYSYGFEVDFSGIKREWLHDIPNRRWRTLLERDRTEGKLEFHDSLGSKIEVSPRELVLSRALLIEHPTLHAIADALCSHFDYVTVKDSHREARLSNMVDSLAERKIEFSDIETLLHVADVGINTVSLKEDKVPTEVLSILRVFQAAARTPLYYDDVQDDIQLPSSEPDEEDLKQVVRHLLFSHYGESDEHSQLSIYDESDGTIAWLAIAVPALERLRNGGLLLVDEIDASLHPHLVDLLLVAFADPQVNIHHAQIIFTSHESFILSPLSEVSLAPEQIWFTDKGRDGVTELFSLADFPKRTDANVARRYLTGRYGGIPRLAPNILYGLVREGASNDEAS